jgi:tetratricopeptide (TPR) repeat protein
MLDRLGRRKEADAIIAEPLRDYSAFLDSEGDGAVLAYAREPFLDLARYFAKTERLKSAVDLWQRHAARLQKFLDRNPEDPGFMIYLAEVEMRTGDIFAAYDAPTDSFQTDAAERLKKAVAHYEKAAALYQKAHVLYAPTQAEKDVSLLLGRKIERLSARR